ncbi:MAG TPA: aminotransferase class III-fold pyridoxal phosphate-dependent enzyme [Spirochaetota bacterium]|nr:aminotransferase class III-fold pyridoxal phosphate-dependent enzyme [Spirochaetota bacterium]
MAKGLSNKKNRAEKSRILELFGKHISHGQVRYLRCAHLDMQEERRAGIKFVDKESGRTIIDAFTSAGCFNVGRGNPAIIAALEESLEKYDMGSFGLLSRPKIEFARKLVSLCPGDLNRMVFAGSGADAIDGALKLALGATGRKEVISMIKAYHGHSGFSLSANGKEYYKHLFEPLIPGFRFAPFGDLQTAEKLASRNTAAVIIEPVQGEGGIHVGSDEYLKGLRTLCDRLGIMLIFDEIQTGLGRTGRLWGSEHSGVIPDIMVVAKSISGGLYPNAAIVYRDIELLTKFIEAHPDFHPTSGGCSDLGCSVSSKVLDYLMENRIWENAARTGARFKAGLEAITRENPKIVKEVRGRGLMIGVEYKYEFIGALIADCLAKEGIWAAYSGNAPQVMRFQIPTIATDGDIDEILLKMRRAVKAMKPYLVLMMPLARIPLLRKVFDNLKVQIVAFNLVRDLEEVLKPIGGR